MNKLCIYHKNCPDGLAAALVVYKKDHTVEFMTAQYGDEPPEVDNKDVIIVDFSYPREILLDMKEKAKSLFVIDHHKTAEEALAGLDFCLFDMDKSGAVLTWEYVFPNIPIPQLLLYVQDRDLWQWKLEKSKEVSAALRSYKPFFSEWEEFLDDFKIKKLWQDGEAILRYQHRQVEMALSHKLFPLVVIGSYQVPCINSTHLISEIGNELCQDYPFAACYFDTNDGKRVFSLRSSENGIDVSVIAKQYGGGGHFHAAGFIVERPQVI